MTAASTKASTLAGSRTSSGLGGEFLAQRLLDVRHGPQGCRVRESYREFVWADVLEPLMNPPQVTLGVP